MAGPLSEEAWRRNVWALTLIVLELAHAARAAGAGGRLLGGAITLAYSLGALIVPGDDRGAAFGWLALGVQVGTALSPLVSGGLAAVSLPGTFVFDGALALAAAAVLGFGARGLRTRREAADR